jgi:TRAP transporter TAXI family solute receptor
MMSGSISGASLQMSSDLADVLNEIPQFRIVPMIGTGAIQNINDLLYLKGVDVAIVQQDVLSHLRRTKRMPGIEDRVHFIAKLHSEEFHVLARMKFMCLADLTGRKVNFGPEDSGAAMTAQAVFETHKVKVRPQYLDQATALAKLRNGEIDAAVLVSGKPSPAFGKTRYTDFVHFLDVEFTEDLQRDYLPAIMTHDDYPDLIAPNETVSTIAVSAVMVASPTRPKNEQAKLTRFVESFFSKFDQVKQKPHHSKWQEVNLYAPVAGWTRLAAAEQWLAEHPQSEGQTSGNLVAGVETRLRATIPAGKEPPASEQIKEMFQKFLRTRKPDGGNSQEELFNQFMHWYQQNGVN